MSVMGWVNLTKTPTGRWRLRCRRSSCRPSSYRCGSFALTTDRCMGIYSRSIKFRMIGYATFDIGMGVAGVQELVDFI